tara:strand:- start:1021 stop:1329 length:309 start_codon:yes stop_codon:yes gene_type:complete
MSFFKKFFGNSEINTNESTHKQEVAKKKPKAIPLKDREKVQVLHTISEKNYKIVRSDDVVGDQIDHYQYYGDDGKGVTNFTQILWLFDNMVKSNLSNVKDNV